MKIKAISAFAIINIVSFPSFAKDSAFDEPSNNTHMRRQSSQQSVWDKMPSVQKFGLTRTRPSISITTAAPSTATKNSLSDSQPSPGSTPSSPTSTPSTPTSKEKSAEDLIQEALNHYEAMQENDPKLHSSIFKRLSQTRAPSQ